MALDDLSPMERQYECEEFLKREAELLDAWDLWSWLDLLTDDVEYRVPLRVTKERGSDEFSDLSNHYSETKESLELRIRRFDSDYAWSENPPSRIRHFLSNVRVAGVSGPEVTVHSNFLLYRSQGDQVEYDLLCGSREDVLREENDTLKLAERVVHLDQTVLDIEYISTIL